MNYNQRTENKKIIKKGIKYYLKGKKFIDDKEISNLYFKKSLEYFNKIKKKDKYKQIIEETETECSKLLEQTNKDIFDIIEEGDILSIKNIKKADLKKKKDGLTPLHYAIKTGDLNCLKILLKKGGNIDEVNDDGHTLLDYACLEEDPSAISFLLDHGADMKKHLFFRKDIKLVLNKSDMDLAILIKLILLNYDNSIEIEKTKFIFNYIKPVEDIKIKFYNEENPTNLKFIHLIKALEVYLMSISKDKSDTYLSIIDEELKYNLKSNLGCPDEKIDILLINLVPFIDYPFNISSRFLLSLEIKYLIKKLLRKKYDNNLILKKKLLNQVWKSYINNNIVKEDYIGIITNQWISKINL